MAVTGQGGQQTGQEQQQAQPVSPAATEAGLERVMFAAHEDSGLEETHIRSAAYRAHSAMLTGMGGPEKIIEALDALRQSGAISEGASAIYREALTSAGGDSAKFADTIVQRRAELAQAINNDLTAGPAAAIAILDNVDRSMSAGQVQGRVKLAYESLLEVSNNDMTALNASIDRAVEGGQLNADNARVIRSAAEQAGTDANRFAQLVSENKDGLAQLAVLQAQQGGNGPGGATGPGGPGAGGIFGAMFAGMDSNNPLMQMINAIIMAFTNGRMNLETVMNRPSGQQGPAQTPEGGAGTQAGPAGGETPTTAGTSAGPAVVTPEVAATGAETGPGTTTVAEPEAGVTTLAASDLSFGDYQGIDWSNDALFGFGQNDPLSFDGTLGLNSPSPLDSPSIFRTSFRDDAGFNFGTTPRVNLLSGDMSINGMSPTSRFGMLSNPDPFRISLTDPRVDLTAPNLSETFAKTPDQSADATDILFRTGPGAR